LTKIVHCDIVKVQTVLHRIVQLSRKNKESYLDIN